MCVDVCVDTCVCMHCVMRVCVCVCRVCAVCVCMHVCVCAVCVCVHVCVCVCMHMCVCVHVIFQNKQCVRANVGSVQRLGAREIIFVCNLCFNLYVKVENSNKDFFEIYLFIFIYKNTIYTINSSPFLFN
jgi:hypothetical protein